MKKPTQPVLPEPQSGIWLVPGAVGAIVLIHLLSSFAPGIRSWGIDYWSELPVGVRIGMAALMAILLIRPVAGGVARVIGPIDWPGWIRYAVVLAAFGLFMVFRSRGYAYGDGYQVISMLKGDSFPGFSSQLGTMPLDLIVHWFVHRLIVLPLNGSGAMTYALVNAAGGAFALLAVMRIARQLAGKDRESARLFAFAALTSGAVVLWFGYAEAYTLTGAASLWALALAMESQARRKLIWAAWALWILACAFHLLAVALGPAILWATVRRSVRPQASRWAFAVFAIGFAGGAVATAIFESVGPHVFVPLWRTADSAYTAFSPAHLVDVLNQLFLVAPLALAGVIVWVAGKSGTRGQTTPGTSFEPATAHGIIAIAAAGMWLFAFWVDPLIGAFRDWDLLAGFGIPASLWGISVLIRGVGAAQRRWMWVPVAGMALVHTGGFVATLRDEAKAALRIDHLAIEDIHYTGEFYSGARLAPWASILQHELGRHDLAVPHLRKRVDLEPTDATAWKNLGAAYARSRENDSGMACYERAIAIKNDEAQWYRELGILRGRVHDDAGALAAFERALALEDTTYDGLITVASTCQALGRFARADSLLERALKVDPGRYEVHYLLGVAAHYRADTAQAIEQYEAALAHGGHSDEIYSRLVQLYQKRRQFDRAVDAARRWEQHFPGTWTATFVLGTGYIFLSQYDSANATFHRCVALRPDHALATYYLANTYRHLGDPDRARQLALHAAGLDSTLALPYLELVFLAADAGDYAGAVEATQEYLRRSPGDTLEYLRQFLQ